MNPLPSPRPRAGLACLLPAGVDSSAMPLLAARGLRAFGDGYMAVLLPAYLLSIGVGTLEVGILSTATMLGSALSTLAVGAWGHRFAEGRLLRVAALLMAATGLGFAGLSAFWPLLVVVLVGTLNPSSGDVSIFLPLEHVRLAAAARGHARTALFARYSLVGALCAAFGALAAAVPDWLVQHSRLVRPEALRGMFLVYAAIGLAVFWLYRRLPEAHEDAGKDAGRGAGSDGTPAAPAPLGPSRGVVVRLAALFSVDAFAGGLTVNALMSLWLLERFGFSLTQAGVFFFWTGLLSAASQLAAPVVAQRIGLLNTMVFTHLPANVCLVLAALAPSLPMALGLLMVRSALSSMDVPTRTAYVMAVVTPAERSAAASFTAVPRSLAAAISPTLSGALFAAGWISLPLVACGLLKISYDLALWRAMRRDRFDAE
ncbi:MFS transporter [Variovorax sp. OK605]|uniref:MFS transporter n=1 Tax=Variovorax sp. OK605 TaxID=1855317 RepID=UPI000AE5F221|nr:MFS transporter [Variovorax sp. OK605]